MIEVSVKTSSSSLRFVFKNVNPFTFLNYFLHNSFTLKFYPISRTNISSAPPTKTLFVLSPMTHSILFGREIRSIDCFRNVLFDFLATLYWGLMHEKRVRVLLRRMEKIFSLILMSLGMGPFSDGLCWSGLNEEVGTMGRGKEYFSRGLGFKLFFLQFSQFSEGAIIFSSCSWLCYYSFMNEL